jgi:hypothetical protein
MVPDTQLFQAFTAVSNSGPSPSYIRGNLSPSRWVKLILHEHCNHVNFKQLNTWIHQGLLPVDNSVAHVLYPMCCACQFGKSRKKLHQEDISNITASHTAPGQGISADQLEAGFPGCILTTPTPKWYKFVNLWVDHYSRYELLASKREFELFAQTETWRCSGCH